MKIALVGLGKMGEQIFRKLSENGIEVFSHRREDNRAQTLQKLDSEQVMIWFMIPADSVDMEIDEWLKITPRNSILIDGGNSDYRLTKKRAAKVLAAGSALIDVGTSGGIWGYKNGFAMMAGGDKVSFQKIEPILQILAKPEGAYFHFGDSGAGHFVKMTHNAIEYGMMESLAEGYRLLKEGPYKDLNLAAAGDVWQHHSVVTSWLNELSRDALKENPELNGIDGIVAESGEARWAIETARELGIETPSISASFDVRLASQNGKTNFATKLLAAMRNAFGGHKINGK